MHPEAMTTPGHRSEPKLEPSNSPYPNLDGHLLRLIAGGGVATGRPRGRVSLDREQRYRQFLEALGVAVYTTDANGRITFYNEAAAAFWGRRPELGEEWCGSLRIFRPDGEVLPHDQCPMAVALRENRPVRGEEAIAERPDGSRVWFAPYPTPLRDRRGRLVGAVNVLVDVTERRRAEQDLRRLAVDLETSNGVKDEFLGLVSHELRTPVTTIFGNALVLRDRGDALGAPVRAGMVADIVEDAERLHSIIENLLQLTRLGSGTEPELEPQVIDHVVRREVEAFRRRRPDRPVQVTGGAGGAIVEGDETWLALVVNNLLTNADKYSSTHAPIEVTVRATPTEVEVSVLDDGMGIDAETADHLFQPFFRSQAARAKASGIGIGLTVCRRIVESLGGRIWARARSEGGAVVGFVLPVADLEALT